MVLWVHYFFTQTYMKRCDISPEEHEKLMVLATLWTTFAGAFLVVVVSNF